MGSNETSSTSTPLTGTQRAEIFNAAKGAMGEPQPKLTRSQWIAANNAFGASQWDIDRAYATYSQNYDTNSKIYSGFNDKLSAMGQYDSPNYIAPNQAPTATYTGAGTTRAAQFSGAEPVREAQQQAYSPLATSQFNDAGQTRGGFYVDAGPARSLTGEDYNTLQDTLVNARLNQLKQSQTEDQQALDDQMAARGLYSSGLALRAMNDLNSKYSTQEQAAISDALNQRYNLQTAEQQALNNYGLNSSNQSNQFSLANAGMLNEGDLARANAANQFYMSQNAMINDANTARTGASNQFNLANAQMYNTGTLDRANAANQFNLSNTGMLNEGDLARANAANQFNLNNYTAQQQANLATAGAQNTWNADQTQKSFDAQWRPYDYLQGLWNGTGGSVSSSTGGGWSI